jgi:hypothetical protein
MAVVRHHDERRQAGSAVVLVPPPPPQQPLPPPSLPRPHPRRSAGDRQSAPAGKTRLDHIGFDELRKYFYMPITRAAREMNVGLTVLKKRCRELGVARWPHRKMKSLKSLMANVQVTISTTRILFFFPALHDRRIMRIVHAENARTMICITVPINNHHS